VIELEERGVPTVLIHTEAFRTLAKTSLEYRDFGYVPLYELPRLMDNMDDDEVRQLAKQVAMDMVAKLVAEAEGSGSGKS
jgi:hypothetical protein